jgi:hypothetical protein
MVPVLGLELKVRAVQKPAADGLLKATVTIPRQLSQHMFVSVLAMLKSTSSMI